MDIKTNELEKLFIQKSSEKGLLDFFNWLHSLTENEETHERMGEIINTVFLMGSLWFKTKEEDKCKFINQIAHLAHTDLPIREHVSKRFAEDIGEIFKLEEV